jgi:hypothetical protein
MIKTQWRAGAVASLVMAGAATLAVPGSASAATWQVIPVPVQAVNGVVPDSATDAWGTQVNPGSDPHTFYASVVHLSGTAWSTLAVPGWPGWANEAEVAADSPTDVWVTGDGNMAHYDGSSWTTYTGLGSNGGGIIAIISPANVWTGGGQPTTGLALQHWDGTKWSPVTAPRPAGASYASLVGLSAIGGDLWALAGTPNGSSTEYYVTRWDGTSWSPLTVVPTPALQGEVCVTNISAASATDVWVRGNDCYDSTSFVMHYNGSAWSTFQMPAPAGGWNLVYSIAARGNEAWAVGYSNDGTTGDKAAAWHWDGSTWSSVAIPVTSANSIAWIVSYVPGTNTVWIDATDPTTTSGLVIVAGG